MEQLLGEVGLFILTDFRARSFYLQSSPPAEATAGSAKTSPSAYPSGEFSGKPWLSDWLIILLLIKRFSMCERGWPNLGNSKSIVASPTWQIASPDQSQSHLGISLHLWCPFFLFLASLGINYEPCQFYFFGSFPSPATWGCCCCLVAKLCPTLLPPHGL